MRDRNVLLNLLAVAVIALGAAHLTTNPASAGSSACYLNGEICSDGAKCCVTNGVCYNDCSATVE